MIIDYKRDPNGHTMKTVCPHNLDLMSYGIPKVQSMACQDCRHYVGLISDKQIKCNFGETDDNI